MAQALISKLLNDANFGCDIQGEKINHLSYMDDLKTFGKDSQQQERTLQIVKRFSDVMNVNFVLEV